MGLTEETISNLAFEIGSFLDEKVDPKNERAACAERDMGSRG